MTKLPDWCLKFLMQSVLFTDSRNDIQIFCWLHKFLTLWSFPDQVSRNGDNPVTQAHVECSSKTACVPSIKVCNIKSAWHQIHHIKTRKSTTVDEFKLLITTTSINTHNILLLQQIPKQRVSWETNFVNF